MQVVGEDHCERVKTILGTSSNQMQVAQGQVLVRVCALVQDAICPTSAEDDDSVVVDVCIHVVCVYVRVCVCVCVCVCMCVCRPE